MPVLTTIGAIIGGSLLASGGALAAAGVTAFGLGAGIAGLAAAGIGMGIYSSMKGASQEKKLQKESFEFQENQVKQAEAKVAGAEALATQTAADKLKKQRLAQTNTILTSPLGLTGEANTGLSKLLGG